MRKTINIKLVLVCSLVGLTFFSCSSLKQVFSQKDKPDLVITRVVHNIETSSRRNVPHDTLDDSVSSSDDPAYSEFTVTIKNIGLASLRDVFDVGCTTRQFEIQIGHYSQSSRIYANKKPLRVGDSVIAHFSDMKTLEPGTHVKFLIETDGKPHGRDISPKVDELNYDNNTFEFVVPKYSK